MDTVLEFNCTLLVVHFLFNVSPKKQVMIDRMDLDGIDKF